MDEFNHCRVCGGDAGVVYPLLPGSPAFCGNHHNPHDAGPFGANFDGPDDFDIPWEDFTPKAPKRPEITLASLPFKEQRNIFTWKTKDGRTYKLLELTDQHVQNIIPYMERRKTEKELPDETLRVAWIERCDRTIALMLQEQQYRKKHHIEMPIMKVKQSK